MMGASKATASATAASSAGGEAKGKPPTAGRTRASSGMIPGKAFDMPNVLGATSGSNNTVAIASKPAKGGRQIRSAALLAESRLESSVPEPSVSRMTGAAAIGSAITTNPRKRIFPNSENSLVGGGGGIAKTLKALPSAAAPRAASHARLQPKPSSNNYSIASLVTGSNRKEENEKESGKNEKGLRHFSAKVCAKVEEKGSTSYNEVADELVQEMGLELGTDNKNIRRRVYDALNVLMAIDVIEKDRKEIRWLGLSNDTTNEESALETELAKTLKRVEEKQKCLKDLIQRKIALHGLIERNSRAENSINGQIVSSSSLLSDGHTALDGSKADRLHLPFILVNAPRDCRVHCEMLEDRTQYFFEFDMPFFINEDIELLRLMGLDSATPDEMKAILTPDLLDFYQSHLKAPESAASVLPHVASASTTASKFMGHPIASHPGRRASGAGRATSTMSSPVFSRRRPEPPAAPLPTTLRQSNLPDSQQQPIGYTGIFRKTNSSHSLPVIASQKAGEVAATAAEDIVSMPYFLSDPFKGE